MIFQIPTGVYVVAVSGGVDSVVLLDMLVQQKDIRLVIAHVDHGIRLNSDQDAAFAEGLAQKYGLPFEVLRAKLGPSVSEDEARKVRYDFLRTVQKSYDAEAVITAHHQDDVIETAMLNMLRGTGRRGITSLDSRKGLIRPLLSLQKKELLEYAVEHQLKWVEDETNQESIYSRNKLRNGVLATATQEWKQEFVSKIEALRDINYKLDQELAAILAYRIRNNKAVLSRSWFVLLDHDIACECMYMMLRKIQVSDIDSEMVERLTLALKVALPGAKFDVNKGTYALITKRSMRFMNRQSNTTLRV